MGRITDQRDRVITRRNVFLLPLCRGGAIWLCHLLIPENISPPLLASPVSTPCSSQAHSPMPRHREDPPPQLPLPTAMTTTTWCSWRTTSLPHPARLADPPIRRHPPRMRLHPIVRRHSPSRMRLWPQQPPRPQRLQAHCSHHPGIRQQRGAVQAAGMYLQRAVRQCRCLRLPLLSLGPPELCRLLQPRGGPSCPHPRP